MSRTTQNVTMSFNLWVKVIESNNNWYNYYYTIMKLKTEQNRVKGAEIKKKIRANRIRLLFYDIYKSGKCNEGERH